MAMGMRTLLLLLPCVVWAQKLDVPVYQGAQKTLDFYLTDEDFLPWLKQGVEFLVAMMARKKVKVPPEVLKKVLGNLKEIRAAGFVLPSGQPKVLLDFYEKAFPAEEGWRTNLWTLSPDGSSAAMVKSKGRLDEVMIFFAGTKKTKGGAFTEAFVVRTLGMIDLGALFNLLSTLTQAGGGTSVKM